MMDATTVKRLLVSKLVAESSRGGYVPRICENVIDQKEKVRST